MNDKLPSVSIIIPTFNSSEFLSECLESIKWQDYPKEKIEIIVVDGGSFDNTLDIAKKYKAKIVYNRQEIHPIGRLLGIKRAKSNLICLLDSDDVLAGRDWLQKMIEPFVDECVFASEPLFYKSEPRYNLVTEYVSLIGADDPVALYLGYFDRYSVLMKKWTGSQFKIRKRMEHYFEVEFTNLEFIPPIGANGTIIRKTVFEEVNPKYFLHVKVLYDFLKTNPNQKYFAKVKSSVVHIQPGVKKFILKKLRRLSRRKDKNLIGEHYTPRIPLKNEIILATKLLLFFPIILDSIKGFFQKPSFAWILHPLLTYLIAFQYIIMLVVTKLMYRQGVFSEKEVYKGV